MINKKKAKDLIKTKNESRLFIKANELRRKQVGEKVTYIKNRNINFTDKCRIKCRFCSFHNSKNYILSVKEIKNKIKKDKDIKEVCIQGGINPDLDFEYYKKLIREINNSFDVHIHAFSPQEIYNMSNLSIEKTLKELKEIGLDSIPGTAAEILVDDVRQRICPNKISSEQWEQIIRKAHDVGLKTTSTMMYGHFESWKHRLDHLFKIKKIQKETSGFTEFIPLPFIDRNGEKKTDFVTDLKVISLSRIILGESLLNIQASWVKLGLDKAIEALYFGANDLGGTLIEENITNIEERNKKSSKLFKEKIREANRKPVMRNTLYEEVK